MYALSLGNNAQAEIFELSMFIYVRKKWLLWKGMLRRRILDSLNTYITSELCFPVYEA